MTDKIEKYQALFQDQLNKIDGLALIVLKSHLIIEGVLDNILAKIFFHPEHLGRVQFFQKIQIVRAFALRRAELNMWSLILAINELRNDIAHNLTEDRRALKVAKLREIYNREIEDKKAERGVNEEFDTVVVINAAALCTGFLASYEEDVKYLRQHIDDLDARINPKEKRYVCPN